MMNQITPVVKNLIVINCIVFGLGYILPGLPALLALSHVKSEYFRPFQLFTYMFVHAGFGHIFFNMLGLYFFGPILETTWGSMRFLTFYIACGIGAGIFNMLIDLWLNSQSFSTMVGASGAIYGLLTAFGILFPNMTINLLFPPVAIKAKYMVMGFGAIALYSALNPSVADSTAHLTHLGGIVVAILMLQFWRGLRF